MYSLVKPYNQEIGPLINLTILNDKDRKSKSDLSLESYKALLDSGATAYSLNLLLAFDGDEFYLVECESVAEFKSNGYYDFIIGRDILALGHLVMLPRNIFSFSL